MMWARLFLLSCLIAVFLTVSTVDTSAQPPKKEHTEMLYPTVLVRVGNGSGSGTVVYSKLDEEQKYESFILTN